MDLFGASEIPLQFPVLWLIALTRVNVKENLRGLRQMQFGSSHKVFQVGWLFLAIVLGAGTSPAQSIYSQLSPSSGNQNGQTGNTSEQQQGCNPGDPDCQTASQGRSLSRGNSQPVPSQGIVLQPDRQTNPNNPNPQNGNQQQIQDLNNVQPPLPLDSDRKSVV